LRLLHRPTNDRLHHGVAAVAASAAPAIPVAHRSSAFTTLRRSPQPRGHRPPAHQPAFERPWPPRQSLELACPRGSQKAPPTASRRAPGFLATSPTRASAAGAAPAADAGSRCGRTGAWGGYRVDCHGLNRNRFGDKDMAKYLLATFPYLPVQPRSLFNLGITNGSAQPMYPC
jgi:hypothetical protein